MLTPSLGATIPVLKSERADVLDRKANSGRAPARSVCGVEPEAALERTGGDAGFAEATQALDKEWRSRQCIGAVNQVIE